MTTVRITHSWDMSVSTFDFDTFDEAKAWVDKYFSDCDITVTESGNIEVFF